MWTRAAVRSMEPSRMPSTPSSRAMSRTGRCAPLYCIVEVRETTRRLWFLARAVMSSSVMPSAKYSCEESPERLASGMTAMEWIWAARVPGKRRARNAKARARIRARARMAGEIITLLLGGTGLGAGGRDCVKIAARCFRAAGQPGRLSPHGLCRCRHEVHSWRLRRLTVFLGYKAITLTRDGLDKARTLRVILERLPGFPDRGIDAVFGVDEDLFAPETVDDFLAGDHAAIFFQEQDEQFHGDAFEF